MKWILFVVAVLALGGPMLAHAESKACTQAKKDLEEYKKKNAKAINACAAAIDDGVGVACGEAITKRIKELEDAKDAACK